METALWPDQSIATGSVLFRHETTSVADRAGLCLVCGVRRGLGDPAMTAQDRALFARCEALEARRRAEWLELRNWCLEDGYSKSYADKIATRAHPYGTLKRWRDARALKAGGFRLSVTRDDAERRKG